VVGGDEDDDPAVTVAGDRQMIMLRPSRPAPGWAVQQSSHRATSGMRRAPVRFRRLSHGALQRTREKTGSGAHTEDCVLHESLDDSC